jgi:hypothetical protein
MDFVCVLNNELFTKPIDYYCEYGFCLLTFVCQLIGVYG